MTEATAPAESTTPKVETNTTAPSTRPSAKPKAARKPKAAKPAETASAKTKPYLVAVSHDEFGPAGKFLDLTPTEAGKAPKGVLVAPTPEQLAQRV